MPPPRKPGQPSEVSDDRMIGALLRVAIVLTVLAIGVVLWVLTHPSW